MGWDRPGDNRASVRRDGLSRSSSSSLVPVAPGCHATPLPGGAAPRSLVFVKAAHPAVSRRFAAGLPFARSLHREKGVGQRDRLHIVRSEEHTSELQSLMRISYAVFCLKKKKK